MENCTSFLMIRVLRARKDCYLYCFYTSYHFCASFSMQYVSFLVTWVFRGGRGLEGALKRYYVNYGEKKSMKLHEYSWSPSPGDPTNSCTYFASVDRNLSSEHPQQRFPVHRIIARTTFATAPTGLGKSKNGNPLVNGVANFRHA